MKRNLYINFLLPLVATLVFNACSPNSDFWGDNKNPNSLTEDRLKPSVLLTPAELNLAYQQGGDLFRYTSIMINTERGTNRQFVTYDNYSFTGEDFNNIWNNLYNYSLKNLYTMYQIAASAGDNHYAGISRVLSAYTYSTISDLWGDIPMDQSLQAPTILQPRYNTQQEVYLKCLEYIDTAISLFSKPFGVNKPGSDDIIYKGDINKWTKFAYTLKIRLLAHLVDKDNQNIGKALSIVSKAFSSKSEDGLFSFDESSNGNPIFQYFDQRGDINVFESYLYKQMKLKNDPRLSIWYDTVNNVVGEFFATKQSSVPLITFHELLFLNAELSARNGASSTDIKKLLDSAVDASFAYARVSKGSYAVTFDASSQTAILNSIAYEKYVALFTHPESFTDWRRFDFPTFPSNTGSMNDLCKRFLYPTSETLYNSSNVPKGIDKATKVWWDTK